MGSAVGLGGGGARCGCISRSTIAVASIAGLVVGGAVAFAVCMMILERAAVREKEDALTRFEASDLAAQKTTELAVSRLEALDLCTKKTKELVDLDTKKTNELDLCTKKTKELVDLDTKKTNELVLAARRFHDKTNGKWDGKWGYSEAWSYTLVFHGLSVTITPTPAMDTDKHGMDCTSRECLKYTINEIEVMLACPNARLGTFVFTFHYLNVPTWKSHVEGEQPDKDSNAVTLSRKYMDYSTVEPEVKWSESGLGFFRVILQTKDLTGFRLPTDLTLGR